MVLIEGIHIKAQGNRRIEVYGQHEELGSNDAYLALPILPAARRHEYIVASVVWLTIVIVWHWLLVLTELTIIPTQSIVSIPYPSAPIGGFFHGLPPPNNVTISVYQTVYNQTYLVLMSKLTSQSLCSWDTNVPCSYNCWTLWHADWADPTNRHVEGLEWLQCHWKQSLKGI